uniref:Uncharacterized protein n=1 Tax=Arundo donax TaxID=35708 RepID=A0A0A9BS19_ARUDO
MWHSFRQYYNQKHSIVVIIQSNNKH